MRTGAMRLLHVFPTFAPGGAQARTVTLINSLGPEFQHRVVAIDGVTTARERIGRGVDFGLVEAPPKSIVASVRGFVRLLMEHEPDLLLTYNWGAIDAVLAAHLRGRCPVVHGEDGFGPDEASGLKSRRVLTRRLVLRRAFATVVPSRTLYDIAEKQYRLPTKKIRYLPNGVDCLRFQTGRNEQLRAELGVSGDELLFGYVGLLRAEKNLPLLLRSFAAAAIASSRLALVGGGDCEGQLRRLASELGIAERVLFVGMVDDTAAYYRAFDVFALSSFTEQMPISLLEAMASGLPAICTNVGDCAIILDESSSPAVVPDGDAGAYSGAMRAMTEAARRQTLGARNRMRCESEYSLHSMVEAYRSLYKEAARQ
jgi:glycosyltransferase involved in cell wall biosynthesis